GASVGSRHARVPGARDHRPTGSRGRRRRRQPAAPPWRRAADFVADAKGGALMSERGLTLSGALVATLLTLGVMGAALSFVAPDSYIAQSRPEAIDMQQRARVGADLLSRD